MGKCVRGKLTEDIQTMHWGCNECFFQICQDLVANGSCQLPCDAG